MSAGIPRLPLEGNIDLTYRCNNNCRHCWLSLPANAPEKKDELTFDEIQRIVNEARAMGCQRWNISGGEPLLRPDFPEIFDYLMRKAVSYSLNTNGTLITPSIARLLKRKGTKMIALYGATAEVYDNVTRNPGGFKKVMRGFEYMKEVGTGFIVQLIPMKANYHQWDDMIALAKSLSKHWRCGAPWLYLSCDASKKRNKEILAQRLSPADVISLDKPDLTYDERMAELEKDSRENERENHIIANCGAVYEGDDRLFAQCIVSRRDFHIDPYGRMSWCSYIKDNALRYDLRKGSFAEAWEKFIPSCADKIRGGDEWRTNCGACESRNDCRWCAVYAYLETGRYSAPIPHLCAVAKEARKFKNDWQKNHRRYYRIAEITIRVDSDLPITDKTFSKEIELFRVAGPGNDTVTIRHHFELPDLRGQDLGKERYRKAPWAIYQRGRAWIYLGITSRTKNHTPHKVVTFNYDHTSAKIYNNHSLTYVKGGLNALTMFPSDQILIARLLADRNGCYLHSAGAILNGAGILFAGHSEAGKSTITRLLMARSNTRLHQSEKGKKTKVEILCDDRNIVRRWRSDHKIRPEWRVYGTWSHGDVSDVSPASAPLRAIFFIEKGKENKLELLVNRKEITRHLLAYLIRPFVTADWWHKTIDLIEQMTHEIPCYMMYFDKSGAIVDALVQLPLTKSKLDNMA